MTSSADMAQAVVESLNLALLSQPLVARRAYLPQAELGEMATLHVTVVVTGRTVQPATRELLAVDHRIEIAVQRKLTGEDLTDGDPLLALVSEIADHLSGPLGRYLPAVSATWVKTEHLPLVAPEHLADLRQFTSILAITYRTWES